MWNANININMKNLCLPFSFQFKFPLNFPFLLLYFRFPFHLFLSFYFPFRTIFFCSIISSSLPLPTSYLKCSVCKKFFSIPKHKDSQWYPWNVNQINDMEGIDHYYKFKLTISKFFLQDKSVSFFSHPTIVNNQFSKYS